MKKFSVILSAVIFILVLSACGSSDNEESGSANDQVWQDIQDAGKIVVATSGTLYPASYYPEDSDEITGYDVEVMKEIANRLDLDIEFTTTDLNGMLTSVQSGRADIAANDIEITDERKEQFNFSDPYKYSYTTMIVRKDDYSGINTLEDLKGKKAGGEATTEHSKVAEQLGAEVVPYTNATNDVYLRDVDNGRTDLIINDFYLQSLALKAFPEFNITIHPDFKFNQTEQGAVFPKDADTLQEKVNGVLDEMREDGTLTELSEQFFGGADVSQEPEEDIPTVEEVLEQEENND